MSETFKHSDWTRERSFQAASGDIVQHLMDTAGDAMDQNEWDGPHVPTPQRRAQAGQEWLERVVRTMDL